MAYKYKGELVKAVNGLLIVNGEIVGLPLADFIARSCGFDYAERMVKFIEKQTEEQNVRES